MEREGRGGGGVGVIIMDDVVAGLWWWCGGVRWPDGVLGVVHKMPEPGLVIVFCNHIRLCAYGNEVCDAVL